eukprot:scaffold283451_cov19-Tisochrysis_lutea.AAC.1
MNGHDPLQEMASRALSNAMRGVFASSLKLAAFHAAFTWLTLKVQGWMEHCLAGHFAPSVQCRSLQVDELDCFGCCLAATKCLHAGFWAQEPLHGDPPPVLTPHAPADPGVHAGVCAADTLFKCMFLCSPSDLGHAPHAPADRGAHAS